MAVLGAYYEVAQKKTFSSNRVKQDSGRSFNLLGLKVQRILHMALSLSIFWTEIVYCKYWVPCLHMVRLNDTFHP